MIDTQRLVRTYVGGVVAATVVAAVLLSVRYSWTVSTDPSFIVAVVAFGVLSLITGLVESTTDPGIGGSLLFVSHPSAPAVIQPLGGALWGAVLLAAA